jgi:AcrR family transcriptional regulator
MEEKKLSRREREAFNQQQLILNAGLKLFSEKGYHYVSIHEIAFEAEFGIGTLYKFFESKEHIYKTLILTAAKEAYDTLGAVLDEEDDPIAVLEKFLFTIADFFENNTAIMRLYFSEAKGIKFRMRRDFEDEIHEMDLETSRKLIKIDGARHSAKSVSESGAPLDVCGD